VIPDIRCHLSQFIGRDKGSQRGETVPRDFLTDFVDRLETVRQGRVNIGKRDS